MAGIKCDRFKKQNENKTKQKKKTSRSHSDPGQSVRGGASTLPLRPACLSGAQISHTSREGKKKNQKPAMQNQAKTFLGTAAQPSRLQLACLKPRKTTVGKSTSQTSRAKPARHRAEFSTWKTSKNANKWMRALCGVQESWQQKIQPGQLVAWREEAHS